MSVRTAVKCAALLLLLCFATASHGQTAQGVMTNNAVIKLVRAGFKEKTVIAIIHSRGSRFDVDPDKLIELKRAGVSENIILAMLAQTAELDSVDDLNFGDFDRDDKRAGSTQNGNDIFGNSSSSNSSTRGRGTRGGNQDSQTTTGSATVRILRPPPDDNTSLKLEKTPTLTNDSIIQLIDAGFSEGTIISRIEGSPVEFDLSDVRVDELRRHRVTDAVINAMKAAMRDDSDSNQNYARPNRSN